MAWIDIADVPDTTLALSFHIWGVDAVDLDRRLTLSTTNGRTRNARRWFVRRMCVDSYRNDYEAGRVTFRAWTLAEAMQRLTEPAIQKRIDKFLVKC